MSHHPAPTPGASQDKDAAQLAAIIGAGTAAQVVAHANFAPSDNTAPEAPGAQFRANRAATRFNKE